MFILKDCLLYHVPMKSKPSMLREVTKTDDEDRVLRVFHGDEAGGCHFGVTATFHKLSERFIITDQDCEFVNSLNQQLCSELDINHRICSSYHPQTNDLTERCSVLGCTMHNSQFRGVWFYYYSC